MDGPDDRTRSIDENALLPEGVAFPRNTRTGSQEPTGVQFYGDEQEVPQRL